MATYLVMVNNIKRSLNHKLLLILTTLLPAVIGMISGLIDIKGPSVRIGILSGEEVQNNEAALEEASRVLQASKGMKAIWAEEDSLHSDLISGRFHAVMDYRQSSDGKEFTLITYQNEERAEFLEAELTKAVSEGKAVTLPGFTKQPLSKTERSLAFLMTFFLVISTVHASGSIQDRNNGTLDRFRFSGNRKGCYLAGYLLQNLLLTYLQTFLCLLILSFFLKGFHITIMQGMWLAVLMSVISSLLGTGISKISKSELQAGILASSVASIASLLGGTFVAAEHMPGLLRILSYGSPVRWIIELVNRMG